MWIGGDEHVDRWGWSLTDLWNDQGEDTCDVRPVWGVWSPPPHPRARGEIQIRHEPSFGYLE